LRPRPTPMPHLLLTPVALSLLVLAAHFLRAGVLFAVVVLIVLVPLLGLRRRWVPRLFQALLALGALEWARTLLALRSARIAVGQPHLRMVAILAGVALFTLLSAALFELPAVRDWYRGRGRD
jgi:hypothetical protein